MNSIVGYSVGKQRPIRNRLLRPSFVVGIISGACMFGYVVGAHTSNDKPPIPNAVVDCEPLDTSHWGLVMVSDDGTVTQVTNRGQVNDEDNRLAIELNLDGKRSYLSLDKPITLDDLLGMAPDLSLFQNNNDFVIFKGEGKDVIFSGEAIQGIVVSLETNDGMTDGLGRYCSGVNTPYSESGPASCSIG